MNLTLTKPLSSKTRWRLKAIALMALSFSLAAMAYFALLFLGASSEGAKVGGFLVGVTHCYAWGVYRCPDDVIGFYGISLICWTAYLLKQEPALFVHWGKSLASAAGLVFGCLMTLAWMP